MSFALSSLLIPIQLCGGKKTKYSKYSNVFRVFLSFSLTFDAIPCYCDYKIRKILRYHFLYILFNPRKKMKKSVSPLSLKEPVQSVIKCIPQGFLKVFDNLTEETLKIFLNFFSEFFTTPFRNCAVTLKLGCGVDR